MKEKRLIKFSAIFVILCMLTVMFSEMLYASEKRSVKVAFFPMDGYHITEEDGSFSGMDVEYLNEISEYVDWEIEYVPCESWEKALSLLAEKKVDLVGSAQYSYERSQIYQYADISSGYTFGVIATNPDSTIAYEDFTVMADISYGMVENYVRKDEFLQYLSDNGIDNPHIIQYESTQELQNALDKGEIDAFVHTFTEVKEGQRLIGRFAPRPFYYITYKGNDDVMRELNQAISDLKMKNPTFENELMNKFYYDRFDKTSLLTTDEKKYIEQKKTVKIGCLTDFYPFSYVEDDELKGLSNELIQEELSAVGFKTECKKYSSIEEAKEALANGEIDILSYCMEDDSELSKYNITKICEYVKIPLVLVMEKSASLNDIDNLVTVPYLKDKTGIAVNLEKTSVMMSDTQHQCLEAVENGEADAALCDGYLAEHFLRTDIKYNGLTIQNVLSGEYAVSMAVRESDSKYLSGILSKTVSTIDSATINEYILKESTYPLMNISKFIEEHSIQIILALVIVMIVIIIVARHIIRDSKKIQALMYKDNRMDIWNMNYLIFWGEHKLLPERKAHYAIVNLDLLQFRRYNTIYGWNAGEKILKSMVDILLKNTDKNNEICARNQGSRFILLLEYENVEDFRERLEKIKTSIEKRIYKDTENRMTLNIGVYLIPDDEIDLRNDISYANQVLEVIGNNKGEEIKIYDDELETMIKERHEREKLLEEVDVQKDFVVYYQNKVDIRSNKIVGAEALVRFIDRAAGGIVRAPGYFVPYYEQTGKIIELDFFVMESVCKMLRRRMDEGKDVVVVSCNFSRMHFVKPGFPERFESILEKYNISKELIEVEITETLVVEELQHNMVKKTLDVLRTKGIRLSIDDFGAGYSSLGVFEQIPASVIKLDRSFLLNQEDRNRQVKIMRGIVKLTEELEAQVVCEGVETDEDVKLMREIGAYVAQGYFYSKPIPEEDFERKLDLDNEVSVNI